MGVSNFVILITGDNEVADQIIARVLSQWTIEGIPGIFLNYAWVSHEVGESPLDFLNRLDGQEHRTNSF